MKMDVLHIILLIGLFSQHSSQDCLTVKSVFVPETFLLPDPPHDWFVPLKEKPNRDKVMKVLSGKDAELEDGGPKTICMSVYLDNSILSGSFNIECSFEYLSQLTCELHMKDDVNPFVVRPLIPKHFYAQPVKTDESTYAAYVACIGEHSNIWFVISNVESLSANIENEIKDLLYEMGLDVDNEDGVQYALHETKVEKGGC